MKFNDMGDVRRFVEDQRIDPSFYVEDYVDLVANEVYQLLDSQGYKWGDECDEIYMPDHEFWKCFERAEKKENQE